MKTIIINEPNKDELYDMYINKKMSADEISLLLCIDKKFVLYFLNRYRIINNKNKCAGKHLKELLESDEYRKTKIIQTIINNRINELKYEADSIESEIRNINHEIFINNYKPTHSINNKSHILHDVCLRCGKKQHGCMHHIIPRQFGGNNLNINLVFLCDTCHDEVEICTYELLNKNMIYDTRVLKSYIIGGFPNEP